MKLQVQTAHKTAADTSLCAPACLLVLMQSQLPEMFAGLLCRYVEVQSGGSWHMKATMVRQAARSSYTCNEAAVGAAISRHDLSIQQVRCIHQQ